MSENERDRRIMLGDLTPAEAMTLSRRIGGELRRHLLNEPEGTAAFNWTPTDVGALLSERDRRDAEWVALVKAIDPTGNARPPSMNGAEVTVAMVAIVEATRSKLSALGEAAAPLADPRQTDGFAVERAAIRAALSSARGTGETTGALGTVRQQALEEAAATCDRLADEWDADEGTPDELVGIDHGDRLRNAAKAIRARGTAGAGKGETPP